MYVYVWFYGHVCVIRHMYGRKFWRNDSTLLQVGCLFIYSQHLNKPNFSSCNCQNVSMTLKFSKRFCYPLHCESLHVACSHLCTGVWFESKACGAKGEILSVYVPIPSNLVTRGLYLWHCLLSWRSWRRRLKPERRKESRQRKRRYCDILIYLYINLVQWIPLYWSTSVRGYFDLIKRLTWLCEVWLLLHRTF